MFRIELELLTGACGASGQTKLKELFMDILPNATKVVEIQSVIQKANVSSRGFLHNPKIVFLCI